MFKKFLYLVLIVASCAVVVFFYYINSIKKDIIAQQNNHFPLHPNLVKETALIFDLDKDGIELIPLGTRQEGSQAITKFESHTFFDIDNDGFAELVSWTKGSDGFLVHDINKNEKIDNQTELFGKDINNRNGFDKLAKCDSNKDGIISEEDKDFDQLKIWQDINSNGNVNQGELKKLRTLGIDKINLEFTPAPFIANSIDKVNLIGSYNYNGTNRVIQDIELQKNNTITHYLGEVNLDVSVLFLPTLKGFGNLPDLHVAMSKDTALLDKLKNIVISFSTKSDDILKTPESLKTDLEYLFFRWAGADQIKKDSRGSFVDAQHLVFMEKLIGSRYGEEARYPYNDPQNEKQGEAIEKSFQMAVKPLISFLVNQIIAKKLYDQNPVYNIATGEMSNGHLSSEGVKYLERLASELPTDKRKNFWVAMVDIILPIKEKKIFDLDEISMLNEAIKRTLPTESLQSIIIFSKTY